MDKLGVDESETSIDCEMSLADNRELLLGVEAEDYYQILFEEKGIMSLPNEVDTNDWIMKQTSPKQLGNFPQASTSSGINPNTALNANFGPSIQLRTSKALSISEDGTKVPIIAKNRAQNKKEIDRKHREKVKENIKRMKDEKHKLHNANGLLEIDNESLRRATNTTNESFQKATTDKQKLDEDICKLKHETQNLQRNVNLYSNQLMKNHSIYSTDRYHSPWFNAASEEENDKQDIYENYTPNSGGTNPYGGQFNFHNQGYDIQSQQHCMALQNWGYPTSHQVSYPLLPNPSVQCLLTQEQYFHGGSSGGTLPQYDYQSEGDQYREEEVYEYSTQDQAHRKRIIDKRYRDKCKKEREEVEKELETLELENENLKGTHEFSKETNSKMKQALKDQEEEINKLENEIDNLKCDKDKTSLTVKALLQQIVCSSTANTQPGSLLDTEASIKNANLDEILRLTRNNDKLKYKNKRSKVKIQALSEKIISDSKKKSEQDRT